MKTLLACRALSARLAVAYLAHAAHSFAKCEPGNTFSRIQGWGYDVDGDFNTFHPYTEMWKTIGTFYDEMGFAAMSDEEIKERLAGARRVGFDYNGKRVTPQAVLKAQSVWDKRKWFRYETKRARRHAWAGKGLVVLTLLTTGQMVDV